MVESFSARIRLVDLRQAVAEIDLATNGPTDLKVVRVTIDDHGVITIALDVKTYEFGPI